MDIKAISVALVAIMVGAVAFGAILPIFQDVTATEDTFTNDGYYDMRYIDTTDDVLIVWDHENPGQISVNNETVTLPTTTANQRRTIIAGDNWVVRYYSDVMQLTSANGSSYISEDLTFTASEGTATFEYGETTKTATYTSLYIPSNTGPYVMKYTDGAVYMNGDSDFIAMGTSTIDGQDVGIKIVGTIDDGATITTWKATDNWTFSDVTINKTSVSGHEDLYKLTTITANAEDDNSHSGTITYSYYMVPVSVTAERTVQGGDGFNTIVNLIPLVIGMGLLLIAVWWFVIRKF